MKLARMSLCAAAFLGLSLAGVATETISYTYDAKGRLVKVERSGSVNNGVMTEYTHDAADNRQRVKVTGSPDSSSCNSTIASGYSASSVFGGYTGLSGDGSGMRDAIYVGSASVHGTAAGDSAPWILMDLGQERAVGSAFVAPIRSTFGNWGAAYLNGATLQRSADGATWTDVATVSGAADGTKTSIGVHATARYLRLTKGQV
ncbi:discoidin domain-containing protein [Sphingopyxis sp. JAI128]|uniref:discoidin domain-containing protein n=1 Tax=Sphingopyxis sp. JAI128 TaxID=2723066 RepID=UPI00161FCDFD|nr:discoidin domain-containing protein [Sphingopyxis sp. JAI128]MBB6428184.1 hypothetical protein [Sphingopyxis sp. JAI128]